MSAKSAVVSVLIYAYVRLILRRANAGRNHCNTKASNSSVEGAASF
jgi:hypothetical protein